MLSKSTLSNRRAVRTKVRSYFRLLLAGPWCHATKGCPKLSVYTRNYLIMGRPTRFDNAGLRLHPELISRLSWRCQHQYFTCLQVCEPFRVQWAGPNVARVHVWLWKNDSRQSLSLRTCYCRESVRLGSRPYSTSA